MKREEKEGRPGPRPRWRDRYQERADGYGGGLYRPEPRRHYDDYDAARKRRIGTYYPESDFGRYRDGNGFSRPGPYMSRQDAPRGYFGSGHEARERRRYDTPALQRGGEHDSHRQEYHRGEKYALKAKRNGSPSRAVGLFGLGAYITEDDIKDFLKERVGGVSGYRVVIVYDKCKKMSKGYGFIQFDTLDDAITVKNRLTGQTIKGKEIRVDYSIE